MGRLPILVMTCAAPALVHASAAAQGIANQAAAQRSAFGNWNLISSLVYTDNFSRIPEADFERRFLFEDGTPLTVIELGEDADGNPVLLSRPLTDAVRIEPIPKTFANFTLNGVSAFDRPRLQGIARGTVSVSIYLDGDSFRDEVEDDIALNLPEEVAGFEVSPSIGAVDAFNPFFVQPDVSTLVSTEIADELLFVEAGGFVVQQTNAGAGGLFNQNQGQEFLQTTFGGLFVSPFLQRRFASDQQVELRYRNSTVAVIDENVSEAPFAGRQLFDNSVAHELRLGYTTGDLLPRLEVSAETSIRRITEEDSEAGPDEELEQWTVETGLRFPVNPRFSLTGRLGYDDAVTSTEPPPPLADEDPVPAAEGLERDFSGVFYSAGFQYRPTSTSSISVNAGERFGGTQINADARFPVTARLRFSARVLRRLSSGLQELQDQQAQINLTSLQVIERLRAQSEGMSNRDLDLLTGGGFGAGGLGGQPQLNFQPLTTASAALTGLYGRTSVGLNVSATLLDELEEDESTGLRGLQPGDRYNASLNISRRMTRRLTASAIVSAIYLDTDQGRAEALDETDRAQFLQDIQEYRATASFNYQINRQWAVTGSYSHTARRIEEQPEVISLFTGTPFEYDRNELRVGVRTRF